MGRILTGKKKDWLHGYYVDSRGPKRGVAYYVDWRTNQVSVGVLTDWLIMCGKNGGFRPNNILVDGVASGINDGGIGSDTLTINLWRYIENSDWAFREVMIWDTALSDTEMADASTALRVSLLYGQV